MELDLKPPYPSRNAAQSLRQKVLDQMILARPRSGERLPTDEELVVMSQLSRSTVRRALGILQSDGWIDRRAGSGTFVGKRFGELLGRATAAQNQGNVGGLQASPSALGFTEPTIKTPGQLIRLAVLVFKIGDLASDWYTPRILEGLDEVAEELGITVELLGNRDYDVDAITRRLLSTRPDVLACLTNEPRQAMVIRDAQRAGVRCIVTGTPLQSLGFPTIVEDNRHAIALGVRHLHENGHRRIGLVLHGINEPWMIQRYEGFFETAEALGLDPTQAYALLIPGSTSVSIESQGERVESFIRRNRLTAVIPASAEAMVAFDQTVRTQHIKVPAEVSMVSVEADWSYQRWPGVTRPTTMVLPFKEMGRRLGLTAFEIAQGRKVALLQTLPATLLEGETVRAITT